MSETKLLDTINSPADVKALTEEQLVQLAGEIRQLIIEVTSKNGGHLAPNLGVVNTLCKARESSTTPKLGAK